MCGSCAGRVLYEMASEGREFASIVPEDDSSDYQHVKDREVGRILKLIFSKVSQPSHDLESVESIKPIVEAVRRIVQLLVQFFKSVLFAVASR